MSELENLKFSLLKLCFETESVVSVLWLDGLLKTADVSCHDQAVNHDFDEGQYGDAILLERRHLVSTSVFISC